MFDYTVRTYIKTASPIGSTLLAEKSGLGVSSATVRNDLMDLENRGYLFQPHTSSGRVPTESGYKFWIENFYKEKDLDKKNRTRLSKIKNNFNNDGERMLKEFAKYIAVFSNSAVVVCLSPDNVYYTGISCLFAQPEFYRYESIYSISGVVDSLDEIMPKLFEDRGDDIDILIGKDNPFSDDCSVVVLDLDKNGLFIILGPIRMDYENNVSIVKFLKELI